MLTPDNNAVVIPPLTFDPNLLFRTLYPAFSNKSIIKLQVVVLPFVPVTVMIVFGLPTSLKKSLSNLSATFPGK